MFNHIVFVQDYGCYSIPGANAYLLLTYYYIQINVLLEPISRLTHLYQAVCQPLTIYHHPLLVLDISVWYIFVVSFMFFVDFLASVKLVCLKATFI